MSKKKQALKPQGYDELLRDIVRPIRQFKAKSGLKAKSTQSSNKVSATPKPHKKEGKK